MELVESTMKGGRGHCKEEGREAGRAVVRREGGVLW